MDRINKHKVFAQYRDAVGSAKPIYGRKYTVTHSDITAELFVFIGKEYAMDQVGKMRDEVLFTWVPSESGPKLCGEVTVDGIGIIGDPRVRNEIFLREMPKALQALHIADRFLFEENCNLNCAPVEVKFISTQAEYAKVYPFGVMGVFRA